MNLTNAVPELSVHDLKALREQGAHFHLIDVRQPFERDIATLGGTLIPLHELPERLDELSDEKDDLIVVYCRSGARSSDAVRYLQQRGFTNAHNLRGGVLAWSREIDPTLPTY